MQHLEASCAVRPIKWLLGVKWLMTIKRQKRFCFYIRAMKYYLRVPFINVYPYSLIHCKQF